MVSFIVWLWLLLHITYQALKGRERKIDIPFLLPSLSSYRKQKPPVPLSLSLLSLALSFSLIFLRQGFSVFSV